MRFVWLPHITVTNSHPIRWEYSIWRDMEVIAHRRLLLADQGPDWDFSALEERKPFAVHLFVNIIKIIFEGCPDQVCPQSRSVSFNFEYWPIRRSALAKNEKHDSWVFFTLNSLALEFSEWFYFLFYQPGGQRTVENSKETQQSTVKKGSNF